MKAHELREKSKEDLQLLLRERLSRADALVLLTRRKKIKNVHELGGVKKDIARILTALKAKSHP